MPRSPEIHSSSIAISRRLYSNMFATNSSTMSGRVPASGIAGLSVEFVAKPQEARNVRFTLPGVINRAFGEVDGFAGAFVFISNHEERLVTVVTLWTGEDRVERCQENVRWVRALLEPYLDRCLRVQTLTALIAEAAEMAAEFVQPCSTDSKASTQPEEEAVYAA